MNLVFSYGSLADRFPNSFQEKCLFIGDYEINTENIFVSLIPSEKSHITEGSLLYLTDEELKKADKYEDTPNTFYREKMTILTENLNEVQAWVYFSSSQ